MLAIFGKVKYKIHFDFHFMWWYWTSQQGEFYIAWMWSETHQADSYVRTLPAVFSLLKYISITWDNVLWLFILISTTPKFLSFSLAEKALQVSSILSKVKFQSQICIPQIINFPRNRGTVTDFSILNWYRNANSRQILRVC